VPAGARGPKGVTELEVTVKTDGDVPDVTVEAVEPGIQLVRIALRLPRRQTPSPMTVSYRLPLVDVHALWRPDYQSELLHNRTLEPPWESFRTSAASGAPVVCAHSLGGANRLTFACSDARNQLILRANVDEETAELVCAVVFFDLPGASLECYDAVLRVDTRDIAYHEALADVAAWWAAMPEYIPRAVPEAAREPVYSTWYAFHLGLTAESVEAQCELAHDLGCGVVIVDDGWQTETVARGYASCGDWQPAASKFPDMRAHVERVQALGLKYLLWFAVPFIGERSAAWASYSDKLLAYDPYGWEGRWGVVDPRFPEVREWLVSTYQRVVEDWGLDGLKLDFLDEFRLSPDDGFGGARDTDSVVDALEFVLDEIARPELLVEFRQTYTGPLMRRFATMLRAYDCPNDALENRVRTLTLRLLAGETAVHSDMLMWHPGDTVESAALQFLNVLFAVPQISVRLDELPGEHLEMLRFWLGFWRAHRDVLLDGRLRPFRPHAGYPLVLADGGDTLIAATYGPSFVELGRLPAVTYVVNATGSGRLVLETEPSQRFLRVRDCRGGVVEERDVRLVRLTDLDVPRSGLVELIARDSTGV
jgi:alpha-galactosidase